jgi:5-methylcytosine-specific restriction endonuclease McrBC regulatory subunit McrC
MRNLYIDFDGVIMNTIEITYQDMINKNINQENQKEVRDYYKNLDWIQLLKKSKIINNGVECIEKIIESEKFEISILTHVNSLHEAVEKIKFIRKYFKDITIIPVPRELSKTEMVHVEDSILIDDYAGNLQEWQEKGGISIRFSEKMHGKGFIVIDKLDKILDII